MTLKRIRENLLDDINKLRDRRGFLYAGLPRFKRLFGRDSLIVSWQLLDIDPSICKASLEWLIKFQGRKFDKDSEEEPGKIIHEHLIGRKTNSKLKSMPYPYYGTVDATPLFVILFAKYFKKTGDSDFFNKYAENYTGAIKWLLRKIESDSISLLRYNPVAKPGHIFHQGWKDSFKNHLSIIPPVAVIEAQGYAYLALMLAIEMNDTFGFFSKRSSGKLTDSALRLKRSVLKYYWMPDEKFFALAINGLNKQKKSITSNPGHLLFTGLLDGETEKTEAVVKRLFSRDIWTPFGIRTHSEINPDFDVVSYHLGSVWPHDNWIIAQGLKKYGYTKEYLKIKKTLINAYRTLGDIPELYAVRHDKIDRFAFACSPQAWASGALLNFLLTKN